MIPRKLMKWSERSGPEEESILERVKKMGWRGPP